MTELKATMNDVHGILFDQLLRISNEDYTGDELEREIKRSEALVKVAESIVHNADVQLKAAKLMSDAGYSGAERMVPAMLMPPEDEDAPEDEIRKRRSGENWGGRA